MKNIKIKLCVFLSMGFGLTALSQNVGINTTGTTPHTSAGLDIDFNDKGVLIPRVALSNATDVVTIPTPAVSLLVYNTGTGGLADEGFHYWDGAQWVPLLSTVTTNGGGIDWTQTVWVQNANYTVPAGVEIVHFWGMTANRSLILGGCSAGVNNGRQIIAVNHGGDNASTTPGTDYNISLTSGSNGLRFPGLNTWNSAASGGYNVRTFVCMDVPGVGYRWTWR